MATEYDDGPKPEQFPFEFLLRHVDDEPTIADYRFFQQAATGIIETALGFAVLGEVEDATKLLETLKNRGLDPFDVLGHSYPFLKPCMYFAWEATSSWPSWIPDDERTEKKLEELETEGRIPWLERFNEEWQVSEETAKKALDMAYQGIATVLPDYDGTLAGQVAQAEIMWKNGEFSSAANPNGPMTVYRTAGLMIALDIYLWLGKEEEAQTTFERICGRLQYEEQVEQLACSRMAWKKLLTTPSRPILDVLQIHPAKLRPAVTRALQMAEHRLEHGPKRRYKGESIEKLAHTVSANAFHNCPYKYSQRIARQRSPGLRLKMPMAFYDHLRLGVTLPEDYKEFLSVSNGLGSMWNGQNLVDYLVKAEDICWQDIDFLEGDCIPLLRDDDPPPWTDNRLDWPEVGSFRAICLSGDQNSEESNGHLFLLPPEMFRERKDYFFKEYEKRNDSQRRELDRVVEETYGSMESFRNLEYVLISWTTWDIEFYPYGGIRDLLERMAEAALHKDRPRLNIFEPRFRRLA
ncbi:hypothetical protein NW755_012061 [Fusarium falciforme]|uniref:Knr4/Smi1-like domain-containing protein n=1 Tax=Fusarium falciforme TaxID=195108 RepID=A0A9W8UWW6_9HYPO|nr:hypothetical protein NW755_012061 [Fusarium falciforme]